MPAESVTPNAEPLLAEENSEASSSTLAEPPSVLTGKAYDAWADLHELIRNTGDLIELYGTLGYSASLDDTTRDLEARLQLQGEYPQDPATFRNALDELQRRFADGGNPLRPDERESLALRIDFVRDRLDRGDPITQPLSWLSDEIRAQVSRLGYDEASSKKDKLDHVLRAPLYLRHACRPDDPYFIEGARDSVRTYLDAPWMHRRWITNQLLGHLSTGELARHAPRRLSDKAMQNHALGPFVLWGCAWALNWLVPVGLAVTTPFGTVTIAASFVDGLVWLLSTMGVAWWIGVAVWAIRFDRQATRVGALRQILSPVEEGAFDGPETARRLRDLERRGIVVDSLFFPLLVLPSDESR